MARKPPPRKKKKRKPSQRTIVAWIVSGTVGIIFAVVMGLVVEARHTSFYGEPLGEKMYVLAMIHLQGLPENPERRARIKSGIPNLNLLPPEAVLPADMAKRSHRTGIQFAYVQESVRPGNGRFRCQPTDIGLIPAVAGNIAAALQDIPDDVLRGLKLDYIIFCGDLFSDHQKVGGFPVPVNDLMLLNLTHRTESRDIREFFMHEFYHLFETRAGIAHDPAWDRLFGTGYDNAYRGNDGAANSVIGTGGYGFINRYSQSYPYEDRAEIFSMLMVSRPQLIRHIIDQQDEMLYAKVKYVAETARQRMGVKIPPL